MRYLLAFKANPNIKALIDGTTPLLLALKSMEESREPRILHKLLLYGSDTSCHVELKLNFIIGC